MPFPKTDTELIAAGYKFRKSGYCRSDICGEKIEWWITPGGKLNTPKRQHARAALVYMPRKGQFSQMKTKIVIELESANVKLVKAASSIMVDYARTAMKYFAAVTGEEMDFNIVHDGKNVTEIIQ